MNLGEKLRQLRQNQNLTQPELAEAMGIEQSYLSKLENGKSIPSSDVMSRILDVFKLEVGEFVNDLDQSVRYQLRQVPAVAEHFNQQKRLIIGDRRRWLLLSTFLLAFGIALIYAGHTRLFAPGVVYSYRSSQVDRPVADGAETENQRGFDFDFDYIVTETYRGEGFLVPVEGGTRVYQLQIGKSVDPWQNKAVGAFGVFLMIIGLTGIVLEKKLSRYQ